MKVSHLQGSDERHHQGAFRERLLRNQGPLCVFTGAAPVAVLEAGTFTATPPWAVHHEHGDLMLRRDMHRLFDVGDLAMTHGP